MVVDNYPNYKVSTVFQVIVIVRGSFEHQDLSV